MPRGRRRRRLTLPIFVDTVILVDISFDPAKRARTLAERGLDFADAGLLLAADALDLLDEVFPIQLVIDALAMGEAAQQLRLLLRPDQDVGLIKVARASSRAI